MDSQEKSVIVFAILILTLLGLAFLGIPGVWPKCAALLYFLMGSGLLLIALRRPKEEDEEDGNW